MPSRQGNKNKLALPTFPPPPGRVCIPVEVPDDPHWIALFTGAIYRLSQQIWYDRDAAHTAKDVAAVWQDIYLETMQSAWGCGGNVDIRLKPDEPCIIQLTTDGGLTWVDKINLSLCWKNGIKYNPATGRLGWEIEGVGFYRFPDGPYIPGSPDTWFPPPRERTGSEEQARCDAAFAAARVLQALYRQTWGTLINWANKGAFLIAQEMMDLADSILGGSTPFDAMIGIAEELHEQESAFQDGGFPDSLIEPLQNILFCNATIVDDRVTFNSADVRADIAAEYGTVTPWAGLNFLILLYLGDEGLAAAGNVDAGTGDCSEAPCATEECAPYETASIAFPAMDFYPVLDSQVTVDGTDGVYPGEYLRVLGGFTVQMPANLCIKGLRVYWLRTTPYNSQPRYMQLTVNGATALYDTNGLPTTTLITHNLFLPTIEYDNTLRVDFVPWAAENAPFRIRAVEVLYVPLV